VWSTVTFKKQTRSHTDEQERHLAAVEGGNKGNRVQQRDVNADNSQKAQERSFLVGGKVRASGDDTCGEEVINTVEQQTKKVPPLIRYTGSKTTQQNPAAGSKYCQREHANTYQSGQTSCARTRQSLSQ
jgi:hypothetical protein